MGTIITIANQKGGVAKTTTTINLGAAFTLQGRRILLVDIDPQANCTKGMGIQLSRDDPGIHSIIESPDKGVEGVICQTSIQGLDIIPSHITLAGAEHHLVSKVGGWLALSTALEEVASDYDYVLIDTPPTLGMFSLNGLVAADWVLIPVEAEIYALDGMDDLQGHIREVQTMLKKNVRVLGAVITKYQGTTKVHTTLYKQLQEYWGEMLFKTIIRKNVDVAAAALMSIPVVIESPKAMASEDYIALAKEVERRGSQANGGDSSEASA
jgi:chromosome partitioning protein